MCQVTGSDGALDIMLRRAQAFHLFIPHMQVSVCGCGPPLSRHTCAKAVKIFRHAHAKAYDARLVG